MLLAARILVVGVALAIGTVFVGRVLHPIRLASHEQREKERLVSEYKRLHAQNEDLRRQLRYMQTPQGVAQEARKHGFVKPGEISLIIPEPEKPAKSEN